MRRHECKACVLYFRLMRTPRPAALKVAAERARKHVTCPECMLNPRDYTERLEKSLDMKQYVVNYEKLMEPADGKADERLGIGGKKELDDDCMIVGESSM